MLLLSELVRENAASNRRVAQSVAAAARQSEGLRELQQQLLAVRRNCARNAREGVRYALGQADAVRRFWRELQALFEDGLEGGEAREMLQGTVEAFDAWFDLAESVRGLWDSATRAGVAPESAEELNTAQRDLERFRNAARELLPLLTRPRPPVPLEILEVARQGVAAGQYQTPEAMRARLQGSGE